MSDLKEGLPNISPDDLRVIARYACWNAAEDRYTSDPEEHPAWLAAARIEALEAKLRAARQHAAIMHAERDMAEADRDRLAALVEEMVGAANRFNRIIDLVEVRCLATDGPVTPTLKEMRETELSDLWRQVQTIRALLARVKGG